MTIILTTEMRYPAEHKEETRAAILAEAAKQIRAHGPAGVGVAEIMKSAGLTHGGFYAHFTSKDQLIAAAIDKMFEAASARWERETTGVDAATGIRHYIDFYLSTGHCENRAGGCAIAALVSDVPRLTPAARKAFAAGSKRLADRFATKLRELDKPRHADPDLVGASVVAELVGTLTLARCEPDPERAERMLAAGKRALYARLLDV